MSTPDKKPFRKRHLFARSVDDVIKNATKPLMNKQGKLYGALLRDWEKIVGAERATVTRPQRLQFTQDETTGAILHLEVRPAAAPELTYVTEQIIEQCARYFGYRAISRIVLHAAHGAFADKENSAPESPRKAPPAQSNSRTAPDEMQDVLARMAAHYASPVVKKD